MLSASQWTSANLTNSCRGTIGSIGNIGPSGPSGPRGQNGQNGLPGSSGPSGPSGPAGASGPSGPNGINATTLYSLGFLKFLTGRLETFTSNMSGNIYLTRLSGTTEPVTIRTDSTLQSGSWFMLKFESFVLTTVYLEAPGTTADGYAPTTRTYVTTSYNNPVQDSVWYVYYYKDPINRTNNLYLY